MSTVISVLAALIVMSIFVVLHELGHYCAGRIFGFGIVEFSVGMGPAIIKKEKNGITYALRALPIGGMCQFTARIRRIRATGRRSAATRYGKG